MLLRFYCAAEPLLAGVAVSWRVLVHGEIGGLLLIYHLTLPDHHLSDLVCHRLALRGYYAKPDLPHDSCRRMSNHTLPLLRPYTARHTPYRGCSVPLYA